MGIKHCWNSFQSNNKKCFSGEKIFCFQEFTIKYRKAEYYQKDFLKHLPLTKLIIVKLLFALSP